MLGAQIQLIQQVLEGRQLVAHPHQAMADIQVARPLLNGSAAAAAEESHFNAGALQHADPQAVAYIKTLHDAAAFVVVESAIGEYPIHIADQEPHLL